MVTIDDELAARTGLEPGSQWLSVRGYRQADGAPAPLCRTEYYISRTFAAVGRLLQRHTGPIFPLIEDLFGVSIAELHQEIAAVLLSPELADGLGVEPGTAALQMRRMLQDLRRRDGTADDQHPSVAEFPLRDDHAPRERPGRRLT